MPCSWWESGQLSDDATRGRCARRVFRPGAGLRAACALVTFLVLTAHARADDTVVSVERSGPHGVVLRAVFDRPRMEMLDFGGFTFEAVSVTGAGHRLEPGRAVVPLRRVLVEIPDGVSISLDTRAKVEELDWLGELPPLPRLLPDEDGLSWRTAEPPVVADAAGEDSSEEEPWARLAFVGWLRARRVAAVEILPVRHDAATGLAHVARELRIELRFDGVPAPAADSARDGEAFEALYQSVLVNPGAFGASLAPPAAGTPGATLAPPGAGTLGYGTHVANPGGWHLKLEVDATGLYAISQPNLLAAGVRLKGLDPRRLALTCRGAPIAILVEGEADGVFDAADRILFFGEPATGPYTRTNAYWLSEQPAVAVVGGGANGANAALRMHTVEGTPLPGLPDEPWFRETVRAGPDLTYWQLMPDGEGEDHWFWTKALAPSTTGYALTLKNPATGSSSVTVRAALHGYTDTAQNPDHHTRVLLNAAQIHEATWNGMVPFLHEATAAASLLVPNTNTVSVSQVADTGAVVDGILADWVEVEYDRSFAATGNALDFRYTAGGPVTFGVFALTQSIARALDVTQPERPLLVSGAVVAPNGTAWKLTFSAVPGAGRRWFVAADAALKAPKSIARADPAIPAPPQGADLVILAPEAFWPALQPLVALRESQGLRVATFDVLDVYDAHGFGLVDPSAIQRFLAQASATWPGTAPTYVLLVGEASYDYLDHLGKHVPNTAPTWLHQSILTGETPTDNLYACVAGDDPLPDLFMGRLPALTVNDVSAVVAKIVAYETTPPPGTWKKTVVHVADYGADFTATLDALATQHVPATYGVTKVYADAFGSSAATHAAIMSAIDAGALMVTYLGHGAVKNWGASLMLDTHVSQLANGGRLPFVVALSCLNGQYASPTDALCLAETFVAAPGKGAVGFAASCGLVLLFELGPVGAALLDRVLAGCPLGAAVTEGKVDAYTSSFVIEDSLWCITLIGDPSSRLSPGG